MRRCLLIVPALLITACSANDEPASSTPPPETAAPTTTATTAPSTTVAPGESVGLDWGDCDFDTPPGTPEQQCATIEVPVDYDEPDGATLDLALARIASDGDDVIGSLVMNPGGPGGSGIDFLLQAGFIMPTDLSERFHLVSFDPRGVGASTAFECDAEIDDNIALVPDGDPAAFDELIATVEADLATCPADDMELAPSLGTNNAARDLDRIRAALDDEQLTYLGFSYGTRLGAVYADLFPDNVRALVLDAAVKPATDLSELDVEQSQGFTDALQAFADACDIDTDCPLHEHGPTMDVITGLQDEIRDVGEFATDSERVLTPGEFDLAVLASLYNSSSWQFLADGLDLAESFQDGSILQALADVYAGRQPDGSYDNSREANLAINCADDPARMSVDDLRAHGEELAANAGPLDDFFRATTGCYGFPDATDPLQLGPATGAAPILVIGTTGDPATPYGWSVELADFLDSAELFTVEGEGHTAFLTFDCVEPVVTAYLIDLEMPAAGESCSDPDPDYFLPPEEHQVAQLVALFDCLRENGVDLPEFTTADIIADPTGETFTEYLDPTAPGMSDAIAECSDLLF